MAEGPSSPNENGTASHTPLNGQQRQEHSTSFQRLQRAGKQIYQALSSHVGLVGLLIAYTFMGAAIFQAIEQPLEQEQRDNVTNERNNFLRDLKQLMQTGGGQNVTAIEQKLRQYEDQLFDAFSDGYRQDGQGMPWDFWGAFFFCCTIYSTIGYGNIAPRSKAGKVATMFYALLGIPLCLVVMASVGGLFTRMLKWLWAKVRCRTKRLQRAKASIRAKVMKNEQDEEAGKSRESEDRSEDETDRAAVEYVVDENFNLPPIVAIVIVILYIFIGAAIYKLWENTWSYLDAFYFIFISISTVGFGDVLPEHPRYFLAMSIYVLFGLSLVAMVINVIMEAVSETITAAKAKLVATTSQVKNTVTSTVSKVISSDSVEEEQPNSKVSAEDTKGRTASKEDLK